MSENIHSLQYYKRQAWPQDSVVMFLNLYLFVFWVHSVLSILFSEVKQILNRQHSFVIERVKVGLFQSDIHECLQLNSCNMIGWKPLDETGKNFSEKNSNMINCLISCSIFIVCNKTAYYGNRQYGLLLLYT